MFGTVDFISIISAIGVICTIIITFLNNSKQHKLSIITSERINKYNKIRSSAQEFFGNARCCAINNNREYIEMVIKSSCTLKILFHYGFSHDKTVIDLTNQIVALAIDDAWGDILPIIDVLTSVIDVYLAAEWARIKAETTRDNRNSQYQRWCEEYDKCWDYHTNNHGAERFTDTDM